MIPKGVEPEPYPGPARPVSNRSFDAIRESLKNVRNNANMRADKRGVGGGDPMSLSILKDSLKLKPAEGKATSGPSVIGGTDSLPISVFGKELRARERGKEEPDKGDSQAGSALKTEFVKVYGLEELGEKLRMLRPEGLVEGKGKFSLEELNERLEKLREMEEKETEARIRGFGFRELRDSLLTIKMSNDEKAKKTACECAFD